MRQISKLFAIFAGLTLITFAGFQMLFIAQSFATGGGDSCNQETTYTIDEDNESHFTFSESGNRVDIDFNGNNDDRNQAIITAGSNYQIMTVRYDTETSNTNWINFSASNPTTTINLAGTSDSTRIDKVEVKVKKVCATPTPTPSPTPTTTPTPTVEPTVAPDPTATPTPTPEDENEEQAGNDQVTPTPTPTPEPTAIPTPTDGASGGTSSTSNDNNSSNSNSSTNSITAVESRVGGISALAPTGTFVNTLMNSMFVSGLITFALGLRRYVKNQA